LPPSSASAPLAAFVVNGARARRSLVLRLTAAAQEAGHEVLVLATTPDDSGEGMTRQALAAGAVVVVAVGGDGTVRACAQELAGTGVPLAIVPLGSANLTARALGIPGGVAALTAGLRGATRRIDVASVGGVISTAMAGIGLDAAVVGATSDRLKRQAGWPAYAAASARLLLARPTEFAIRLDGGPAEIRRARSVFVGNCGLLPGGFPILPDARLDDGVLDVGILAPAGMAGWVSVGYRCVLASRRDDSQLERRQARQVEIHAAAPLPRQVDGEMLGAGDTLSVRVLPGALLVRVPRPHHNRGRAA
jgi:diacylglycerol kinase family enzyme